jgi:benzoyl-CoA reductase subunit C
VRNALSFLLTGGLQETDFILVPHGCDSLQGLGSILIDFIQPRQKVFPFYIPRGDKDNAIGFLAEEIRSLLNKITEATGHVPDEENIRESIKQHRKADELLAQLHASSRTVALSRLEFYKFLTSREYLPSPAFFNLAQAALSSEKRDTQTEGIPILLSGIVPEPMDILEGLSQLGASVVADDLACCGRRLYPPSSNDDVYLAMAQSILTSPPDSTRGSRVGDRIRHLLNLAERSGAKGVIFLEVKFCEPELFYLPLLRQSLEDAGIPSLVLEVELNDPFTHQLRTRIEAFLEMIG